MPNLEITVRLVDSNCGIATLQVIAFSSGFIASFILRVHIDLRWKEDMSICGRCGAKRDERGPQDSVKLKLWRHIKLHILRELKGTELQPAKASLCSHA